MGVFVPLVAIQAQNGPVPRVPVRSTDPYISYLPNFAKGSSQKEFFDFDS